MKTTMSRRSVRILCGYALILSASMASARNLSFGNASGFGLENGTVTINSFTKLIGNVGYSKGLVSDSKEKIDVHSSFEQTEVSFVPEPSAALLGIVAMALLILRKKR